VEDRLFEGIHRARLEVVGLGVFATGALLDLAYHAAPPDLQVVAGRYLGAGGFNAHLVTFVGMVLIAVALLDTAYRARARWRDGKEVTRDPIDPNRFVNRAHADGSRHS
jgi:hypothetical protein